MVKKPKPRGGSAALNPQMLHKTLTWTNPLKFLQDVRFKGFKPKDDEPPKHAPFHEKVSHHLNKIEQRTGKRSIKHMLNND